MAQTYKNRSQNSILEINGTPFYVRTHEDEQGKGTPQLYDIDTNEHVGYWCQKDGTHVMFSPYEKLMNGLTKRHTSWSTRDDADDADDADDDDAEEEVEEPADSSSDSSSESSSESVDSIDENSAARIFIRFFILMFIYMMLQKYFQSVYFDLTFILVFTVVYNKMVRVFCLNL